MLITCQGFSLLTADMIVIFLFRKGFLQFHKMLANISFSLSSLPVVDLAYKIGISFSKKHTVFENLDN